MIGGHVRRGLSATDMPDSGHAVGYWQNVTEAGRFIQI
ncbi:hypothetical protein AFEL58S_01388 [Afipia felis]